MDRVEMYLSLRGDTPSLGSTQDITIRNYMLQDRVRRVALAKLTAACGARAENVEQINKYLKAYISSEYRLEDFMAETDTKLMEEFDKLKGHDLMAQMDDEGVLRVKVSDFYQE